MGIEKRLFQQSAGRRILARTLPANTSIAEVKV